MFNFLSSSLAWPPGWPGLRLKWAKDRFGSKNDEKVKVLRMEFSIVENLIVGANTCMGISVGTFHFAEVAEANVSPGLCFRAKFFIGV